MKSVRVFGRCKCRFDGICRCIDTRESGNLTEAEEKWLIRNNITTIVDLRETELLKDFLYEAIFIPEGVEPPEKNIVEKPELRVYTDDFGLINIRMI